MDDATRDILTVGWLSHFEGAFANSVLATGRMFKVEAGQTIYGIGEDQVCLYCIVSGAARFEITMNEQPPRFAHLIGPGTWFGENELSFGKSAILEVTSVSQATLFYVNQAKFDALAAQHGVAWKAVAALASMNVAAAIGSVDDLMIRSPRQRLCAVLLRLSAHRNAFQGQPPMNILTLTQPDLAVAANLSRSKTAEIIAFFVSKGAIETIYGGLKITRPEILEQVLSAAG